MKKTVYRAEKYFIALMSLIALTWGMAVAGGTMAMVITINGPINPVTAEYITQSVDKANADPAVELLLIEMDTPGGLDTSMRQIIKGMQTSAKPVVVYVSPGGSRAASAGAFITLAAHVAAMAPGTNIGAASPVSMGGGMDKTMKKKVTNDASAYIRSIAEMRGRNADLAEKFVRKASSIPETEAKEKHVVDIIADDIGALLKAIDGKKVKTSAGERTIRTQGLSIKRVGMNWRQRVFNTLTNPNIAYLLMMLGFYGLMFELYNPGAIVPGVVGGISIILAAYSLQTLPVNFAGVLLILLAVIMFALETQITSFGVLTLGGIVSMTIGSMMLIDSPEDYLRISLSVIIPTVVLTSGFFVVIIGAAIKAQGRRATTGQDALLGAPGVAESEITPDKPGHVFVVGELWRAVAESGHIEKGGKVKVTSHDGLTLTVKSSSDCS